MKVALQTSFERGEKTALLMSKSEELMQTSVTYKKTATQVKRTMCVRKWKLFVGISIVVVVLVLLLWLILGGKL